MFTVKAVIEKSTYDNFALFSAANVRIGRPRYDSCPAPSNPPDLEVYLNNANNENFEILQVGRGLDHYNAVYVMNEHGKTVQSIYPGPG